MVNEREAPKPSPSKPTSAPLHTAGPVEFGRPSSIQQRQQASSNVFNVPKSNKPRPEHHRAGMTADSAGGQSWVQQVPRPNQPLSQHGQKSASYDPDVIEISRPVNLPPWRVQPRPPPTYSAFQPVNHAFPASNRPQVINLVTPDLSYTSDSGLFADQLTEADIRLQINPEKATENIKALLEGAFEDDDEEMPRTRGRKQKLKAKAEILTQKLKGLTMNGENKENQGEQSTVDDSEEDDDDVDDGTVEGLKVKLLHHQIEGVDWMRDKEIGVKKKNGTLPKGGILADDMGLGKTIQSIALILTNPRPPFNTSTIKSDKKSLPSHVGRNTLIVAPLALIKQWEAELKDKVEDSHRLKVCVHHGPQRTKRFKDLERFDIVITTYQILVSEHGSSSPSEDGPQAGCFGLHWYRVILDEAHSIKNRNAKATKACYALRAEYRWCLTGTPMQNNLDELQSLIKFLRIKPYDDIYVWKDQITRPMNNGRGGIAIKRLQLYLKAFMKRRTKDILKQDGALNPGGKKGGKAGLNGFKIVERRVESIAAEFSPQERKFYDRLEQRAGKSLDELMENEGMNYASALVLLLRLRQACNHPQLLGGRLTADKDALTTGQSSSSPKKSSQAAAAAKDDVDDVADLFGGLTVRVQKCDVCQKQLSRDEISSGTMRCTECEEDLSGQHIQSKSTSKKPRSRHQKGEHATSKAHRQRIIPETDDEGDGDWLVPEEQRPGIFGKAGGTDDEDAEGTGESLALSDTDTDDDNDDDDEVQKPRRKRDATKFVTIESDSESESNLDADTDPDASISKHVKRSLPSSSTTPSPVMSAKIRHLLHILRRESGTHKFIVYSQFTSMLTLIEPFLQQHRLAYTRYDGSMRNDAREAALAALRSDSKGKGGPRILLCSLKCGALGLNLTAASRVVLLEPFWNPFVEEQAIDRVHRLNQTVDVVVYKLTVANTVEGRILDLQEKKRALAAAAVEGGKGMGAGAVGKLTMGDILRLFGREAEFDGRHDGHHHPCAGMVAKGGVLNGAGRRDGSGSGSGSGKGGVSVPSSSSSSSSSAAAASLKAARKAEDPVFGRRW